MPVCPECDTPFNFAEDEVDEGEVVLCEECGTEYEIVATDPLELSKVEAAGYDDEDVQLGVEEEDE
jgi:alpha-aminoadipate carrier protein LysW